MKRISEPLKLEQKRLLAQFIEYDTELDDVESTFKRARKDFRFWYIWFLLTLVVGLVLLNIGFLLSLINPSSQDFAVPVVIVGVCMYVLGLFLAFIKRATWNLYLSFRDIFITVPKVDLALGTVLASKERKDLAGWLILCANRIRGFWSSRSSGIAQIYY